MTDEHDGLAAKCRAALDALSAEDQARLMAAKTQMERKQSGEAESTEEQTASDAPTRWLTDEEYPAYIFIRGWQDWKR